jgi:hypothetical protein
MTARQAAPDGCVESGTCPLFAMGGACWYFAQGLADLGVSTPIGIADTAIGGQRIEEFMINSTMSRCSAVGTGVWDAQLTGQQVAPFMDMTLKGWVWYQGSEPHALVTPTAAATLTQTPRPFAFYHDRRE